jgi:hypothetical protein
MGAAAIGFVGVVVGALLSALLSELVEKRKQRNYARAAAEAMTRELGVAIAKLSSPKESKASGWWVGTPVTSVWRDQAQVLAALAPSAVFDDVAHGYAAIESWIGEREQARTAEAAQPSEGQLAELAESIKVIEKAKAKLETFADQSPGHQRRTRIRSAIVVAILGSIIALGFMLFLPRSDVTASTVAAAVENLEGSNALAECHSVAADWSCTVYKLTEPLSDCRRGGVAAPAETAATTIAAASNCNTRGPPIQDAVAVVGDELLVHTTPGAAERKALPRSVTREPKPTDSRWDRFLDALFGQ